MNFVNKIFSTNPYSSYCQSRTNCRGVGILIKKKLKCAVLAIERDDISDNYILLKADIQNQTVIIGSVYGPNNNDAAFFDRLHNSLVNLGDFPTIIAGDWNATFSCLPVDSNPDVLNMQAVPNMLHSRLIRNMCEDFNLNDPYRVLYPNRLEYSYAPWGNIRNNRSRIDFFLITKGIANKVQACEIKPTVQSKLFDHKAITLDFKSQPRVSSRPNISNKILLDPDLDSVVMLAMYECYAQHLANNQILKNRVLGKIGEGYRLLREAGPDPRSILYSHLTLLDIDNRDILVARLKTLLRDLEISNFITHDLTLRDDVFLEHLINNIRNEVISYQSFVFKKSIESYDNLVKKLEKLKTNYKENLMV